MPEQPTERPPSTNAVDPSAQHLESGLRAPEHCSSAPSVVGQAPTEKSFEERIRTLDTWFDRGGGGNRSWDKGTRELCERAFDAGRASPAVGQAREWQTPIERGEKLNPYPEAVGQAPATDLLKWAIAERDAWDGRNADRYWQMNRVIAELRRALAVPSVTPTNVRTALLNEVATELARFKLMIGETTGGRLIISRNIARPGSASSVEE